jgi:hypothetical protein
MSVAAADFAPVRFSTGNLPERERLTGWREEFGRGMLRLEIEPLSSDLPFHAEATFRALPGVRMVRCAGSAVHWTRTRTMVADGDDSIGLVVNLAPEAAASQGSADVVLQAGDCFPFVTDDFAVLTSPQHLGILLPRAVLTARVRDLDRRVMQVIPRTVEPLRLLVTYIITLVREEVSLSERRSCARPPSATFTTSSHWRSAQTGIHARAAWAQSRRRGWLRRSPMLQRTSPNPDSRWPRWRTDRVSRRVTCSGCWRNRARRSPLT